jgi:thiol-disulfide isomerase/thioredoxin
MEEHMELVRSNRTCICDVHAISWCSPCKMIAPVFNSLANEFSQHCFFEIDIDSAEQSFLNSLNVASVPLFIKFKDGLEVDRLKGSDRIKLRLFVEDL